MDSKNSTFCRIFQGPHSCFLSLSLLPLFPLSFPSLPSPPHPQETHVTSKLLRFAAPQQPSSVAGVLSGKLWLVLSGKGLPSLTWLTWLYLGPAWVRISLIIWQNLEWEKSLQHSRAELLCRKECVTDRRSSNSSLTSYAYDTYSLSKQTLKNVSFAQNSGLWPVYHLF